MDAIEPSSLNNNMLLIVLSFGCYYLGIVIRKVAMPRPDSPSWGKQLLLGIPLSLLVVTPLLVLLQQAFQVNGLTSVLTTLGIIMEHGMVLNETATKRIKQLATK